MNHPMKHWMIVRRDAGLMGQQIEVSEATGFADMQNYRAVCGHKFSAEVALYSKADFSREAAVADYERWN